MQAPIVISLLWFQHVIIASLQRYVLLDTTAGRS